jgi:hypothetical protein
VVFIAAKKLNLRASDASSASLKRPGKNQVIERRDDSNVDIVETLLMRNDSYLAFEEAITSAEERDFG